MEITIKTVTKKITPTIFAQMEEATYADMLYAVENGKVLGYINPVNHKKERVFLIVDETGDYKKVSNLTYSDSEINNCLVLGKTKANLTVKRTFASPEAKEGFKTTFATIKRVAEKTHIYI